MTERETRILAQIFHTSDYPSLRRYLIKQRDFPNHERESVMRAWRLGGFDSFLREDWFAPYYRFEYCAANNHPAGGGCNRTRCTYPDHYCMMCNTKGHGAFMRNANGEYRCPVHRGIEQEMVTMQMGPEMLGRVCSLYCQFGAPPAASVPPAAPAPDSPSPAKKVEEKVPPGFTPVSRKAASRPAAVPPRASTSSPVGTLSASATSSSSAIPSSATSSTATSSTATSSTASPASSSSSSSSSPSSPFFSSPGSSPSFPSSRLAFPISELDEPTSDKPVPEEEEEEEESYPVVVYLDPAKKSLVRFDLFKDIMMESDKDHDHATIYRAVYELTDIGYSTPVAVKSWEHMRAPAKREATRKKLLQEITGMQKINSRSVVTIYAYCLEQKIETRFHAFLVMELCEKDLAQYFQDRPRRYLKYSSPIVPDELRMMTFQLLQMYKDCHDCGVCHRDVKPENILVTSHAFARDVPVLKLCDFECSKVFKNLSASQKPFHSYVGTVDADNLRCWMAPEVARCYGNPSQGYDHRSDIWSVGCVIAWVALEGQRALFCTTEERDRPESREHCLRRLERYPLLQDLVDKMTRPLPEDRISLDQAQVHPALFSGSNFVSFFHVIGNEMKTQDTPRSRLLAAELERTPVRPGLHPSMEAAFNYRPHNLLQLFIQMRNSLEHILENCSGLHPSLVTDAQNRLLEKLLATSSSLVLQILTILQSHGRFVHTPSDGFQYLLAD